MSHPYSGHKQEAVGHRRAKLLTTGKQYARGGAAHGPDCNCARCRGGKAATGGRIGEYAEGGKVQGEPAATRLDKRARGGGIHQITPSKRKPHTNINIVNVTHRPRPKLGMPMGGPGLPSIGPAMPAPPGAGLPLRKSGGKVTKPNKLWGGAPYGGAGSDGMARLTMAKRKPMK